MSFGLGLRLRLARRRGHLPQLRLESFLIRIAFQLAREFSKLVRLARFDSLALGHQLLPRLGADSLGDYAAFTDESSITGHRYMVVGGVSCRSAYAQTVHERIASIRRKSKYSDSLQWKHFRPDKFYDYRRMIDYFLIANESHRLDFTCLVVDTKRLNHGLYNMGDGETFFQKTMYLVLVALTRKYGHPPIIRAFHGRRESRYDLMDVKAIINAGLAKEKARVLYRPVKQFDYMDVSESGPHQLADTLLGAVSYYWNEGLRRGGESRKRMLAEYIQSECCVDFLGEQSPKSHFDIWPMRLR